VDGGAGAGPAGIEGAGAGAAGIEGAGAELAGIEGAGADLGGSAGQLDAVFSALADPTRRAVVRRLLSRDSVTATQLAGDLPISRQAVSKHLAALVAAGLVASRREGRETRYRLTPRPLGEASAWLGVIGAEWDARLERLRRAVVDQVGDGEQQGQSHHGRGGHPEAGR
jgi:DNA-binding transcriptional ArsR family regulator